MGQCGCNDFQPMAWFEGPDDDLYAVELYPGCEYCGTPAGVVIYRLDPEYTELWELREYPKIEPDLAGICITVMNPETLSKLVSDDLARTDEMASIHAEEVIKDRFYDAVRDSDAEFNAGIREHCK